MSQGIALVGMGCRYADARSPEELWQTVMAQRRAFLSRPSHKHVFHYVPRHGSWLNQVELFFSILARRLLKRGEFRSVEDLVAKVMAFIADYNRTARPFRWTYDGRPLKAS